jgi:hypothetical protein
VRIAAARWRPASRTTSRRCRACGRPRQHRVLRLAPRPHPPPRRHDGVVCYFSDISEQVWARHALAVSENRYRTLFESIDEGFCILQVIFDDDDRRSTTATSRSTPSSSATPVLGRARPHGHRDRARHRALLVRRLRQRRPHGRTDAVRRPRGVDGPLVRRLRLPHRRAPRAQGGRAVQRHHRAQAGRARPAGERRAASPPRPPRRTDGLPNRLMFEEKLRAAVAAADRHGRPFAVLFLDLDGFKAINDDLGHACGDVVLIEVARRLRRSLRATTSWRGSTATSSSPSSPTSRSCTRPAVAPGSSSTSSAIPSTSPARRRSACTPGCRRPSGVKNASVPERRRQPSAAPPARGRR